MKKTLTLIFGLMIAAIAVWAIPREIKKDATGIEKQIQMKIEIVKNQVIGMVTITEQGESPGQLVQYNYSFNVIEQVAEDAPILPIDYPYTNWRMRQSESNKNLAEIKLTWKKNLRRYSARC